MNRTKYVDYQLSGLGITRVQYRVPLRHAIGQIESELENQPFKEVIIKIQKRRKPKNE